MDLEISALAVSGCAQHESDNRSRGRRLQAFVAKTRAATKAKADVKPEDLQLLALAIPGAAEILNVRPKSLGVQPIESLMILALSPRVRGSGRSIDRVRGTQSLAVALVARAALARQAEGLLQWLDPDCCSAGDMRGFSGMWDEATQRSRALLRGLRSSAQALIEVFVLLGSVFSAREGQCGTRLQWQPWLSAPRLLNDVKQASIMSALDSSLPFQFRDQGSLLRFGQGVCLCILSFCFDMASANVAVYANMVKTISALPDAGRHIMMHGERCLTHALHIIKVDALTQDGISGMLYSFSKIITHSRSLNGLVLAMSSHIRNNLEVRYGAVPEQAELLALLKTVMSFDGDERFLFRGPAGPSERKETAWLRDLQELCLKCHWENGRWIYFAPLPRGRVSRARLDPEHMVSEIMTPLLKIFVARRWQQAATNRWSGTIDALKKLVLGCVVNNILPMSLAGLGAEMHLTEAQVDDALRKAHAAQLAGEDRGEGELFWASHCKRVLRMSIFFRRPECSWKMGVVLIAASLIDRLHWAVLGCAARPKLQLHDLVDVQDSEIAKTMCGFWRLVSLWSLRSNWQLLKHLGRDNICDESCMDFARALVVRMSAGAFLTVEMRLANWPYRLWLLASPNVSREEREVVIDEFLSSRPCCLGPFGRRFKAVFSTRDLLLSTQCVRALQLWSELLRFSTYAVEIEHKTIKEDCHSLTSGASLAPVCHRAVCKHLNAAHVHKGNRDVSLPLRKAARGLADTGVSLGVSRPALHDLAISPAIAAPLTDDRALACEQVQEGMLPQSLAGIGGGNAKVCFINARIQAANEARGSMDRASVQALRKEFAQMYDASDSLRQRWGNVFRVLQARKRIETSHQIAPASSAVVVRDEPDRVWPDAFQSGTVPSDCPMSPLVLSEVKSALFPTMSKLREVAQDDTDFRTVDRIATPPVLGDGMGPFACCGQPRSACRMTLALQGTLRRFDAIRHALNRYVDAVPKSEIRCMRCLFALRSVDSGGQLHKAWFLLAKASFRPKMQVLVHCAPQGSVMVDGFSSDDREPPYVVSLQSRRSLFCPFGGRESALRCLHHEASECVIRRLVSQSDQTWTLVPLVYRTCIDAGNLTSLRVEGSMPPVELTSPNIASNEDEQFLSWLAMPRGSARSRGQALARLPPLPDLSSLASAPGASVHRDEEDVGVEEDPWVHLVDASRDELLDVAACEFDLEHALADIIFGDVAENGDLECEAPDAGPIEAVDAPVASPPPFPTAPPSDESSVLGVHVVDLACVERTESVASVLETAGPELPPGTIFSEDGTVSLTPLGYVRCMTAPHNGQTVGLVGEYADGLHAFANCHLHPKCAIKCGTALRPVSKMKLAVWLSLGVPSRDLPADERRRLGAQHRGLWSRDGPLGSGASSSGGP